MPTISPPSRAPAALLRVSSRVALHSFDEMPRRNEAVPNAVLSSLVRHGDPVSAWRVFLRMHRSGLCLNGYTFTPLLSACSAMSAAPVLGGQVHCLVVKLGLSSETVVQTALVDMYVKCGSLPCAVRAFEETALKDVVAWNCMISGFVRHGLAADAIGVFRLMQKNGAEFNGFTLCSVLKACCPLSALMQGKQIHTLVIVTGDNSVVLGSALVDFYSACGLISDAIQVFNALNCEKDEAIHNALLSGYARNGKYEEVMSIIRRLRPNAIALTTVLSACAAICDLISGMQVHAVVLRGGFEYDVLLCNALLSMYAKSGKVDAARSVFHRIGDKNVVTWTSMIDAYGSHGCGFEALELFRQMCYEGNGISPNDVTFLTVLAACGHSGLVEQARECFVTMTEKYGLKPGPEHYACFIDLLGRAGRVEEAWDVYRRMEKNDIVPTGEVWAALLNASRLNLDVVRGEFAAKALFEHEPDKPANYVSLSNFYAAVQDWEQVEKLRKVMKEKGMGKELGSSQVDIQCCNS